MAERRCHIKLIELIRALDVFDAVGGMEIEITGLECHSGLVERGAVFVAIPGFKRDGVEFAAEAVARGAVAVVAERPNVTGLSCVWVTTPDARKALSDLAAKFYGYPGKQLKVLGVTGTNGKTTSAFLLRRILQERGKRVGLISSILYDTCGDSFPAERTTPESLDIQRLLFLMRANGCNNVVMEVSSHALALKRVDNVEFRVGLFTNLTRDHLDFHGDMKAYLAAKAILLEKLDGLTKYAVINLDEPYFRELFGCLKSAYLTFSLANPTADVFTTGYDLRFDGTYFDLVTPLGSQTVRMKLCGRFNLMNALGAIAGGLASGVDLDAVVAGVEAMDPVPGRFQRVDCGQKFAVVIDYAHTPDAIARVIETARGLTDGKIYAVFGCGGDRDRGKRPLMGAAATENADFAIVTTDNPRSEEPLAIIDEIKPGLTAGKYQIQPDRRLAIREVFRRAQAGDVALLLGKGAEEYEEVAGVKKHYSEIDEAHSALHEMGYDATVTR